MEPHEPFAKPHLIILFANLTKDQFPVRLRIQRGLPTPRESRVDDKGPFGILGLIEVDIIEIPTMLNPPNYEPITVDDVVRLHEVVFGQISRIPYGPSFRKTESPNPVIGPGSVPEGLERHPWRWEGERSSKYSRMVHRVVAENLTPSSADLTRRRV